MGLRTNYRSEIMTKSRQLWYNVIVKENGPGGVGRTPRPGPRRDVFVARHRILRGAVRHEVKRTILREAEERYRHALMGDEERQLLLDRIKRLRKALDCGEV